MVMSLPPLALQSGWIMGRSFSWLWHLQFQTSGNHDSLLCGVSKVGHLSVCETTCVLTVLAGRQAVVRQAVPEQPCEFH
jgi:hypothetical protein